MKSLYFAVSLLTPLSAVGQVTLTSSGPQAFGWFGMSVDLCENTTLVGSRYSSGGGEAFLFGKTGGSWVEVASFQGGASSYFGQSVALDAHTAVVGAPQFLEVQGKAFVFQFDGGAWSPVQELTSSHALAEDFGTTVAVDDDLIVMGVRPRTTIGAVFVFRQSAAGTWEEEAILTSSDGEFRDTFGYRVAVEGSIVVVGAKGDDESRGAVYVFEHNGSSWLEVQKITPLVRMSGSAFGSSLDVADGRMVVGAELEGGVGAAYVFREIGNMWVQEGHLVPSDGQPDDLFGYSAAIDGPNILVGAHQFNNGGPGAVYHFKHDGSAWNEEARLVAPNPSSRDQFGQSVAVDRGLALVGSTKSDIVGEDAGAAYLFDIGGDSAPTADANGPYSVDEGGTVTLNTSWISDNYFDDDALNEPGSGAVVAMNAPQNKLKLGLSYARPEGFNANLGFRYVRSFDVVDDDPVYRGTVDSYALLDVGAGYDFSRYVPGLRVDVTAQNALDNRHREYIGVPMVGRLVTARL